QNLELVAVAAVFGHTSLDVRVKGPARVLRTVPAEDRVGFGGGELAALLRVPGLKDDRSALRRARDVEPAFDVEELVVDREGAGPRVEQRLGGPQETLGALVALVLRQ